MSEYAEYVFKKYETICKTCGASSRKGSLKCWVCGKKINDSKTKKIIPKFFRFVSHPYLNTPG